MRTLALVLISMTLLAQQPNGAAINPPWPAAETIHAADLAKMVADKKSTPAAIFQVGFETMFKTQHVPGSVYAGPGRNEAGLELLKRAVAGVPKDSTIVLYCGCCPWEDCPNVRAALHTARSMGFKHVRSLFIPRDLKQDWIDKGYPTSKS